MNYAILERSAETSKATMDGIGLITGLPVSVVLKPSMHGNGIVFIPSGGEPIPARLSSIAVTDRGVTLANKAGQTLSIVEHFLAACAMAGIEDLVVEVDGAPELPILDGSAKLWLDYLREQFAPHQPLAPWYTLNRPVTHQQDDGILIYGLPSDEARFTYAVNFDHPDLQNRFIDWRPYTEGMDAVAPARTFGHVRELPVLQARGLAKGVSYDNTLGLTDDGGYTDELRLPDEPVRHKLLDFLGDMMLSGINPLRVQAHWIAINAGHASHTAFARKLLKSSALQPI
jgi:UDP-3-O-[3-hydroxymyristoyl] N-acetylglucosamine deacetylase